MINQTKEKKVFSVFRPRCFCFVSDHLLRLFQFILVCLLFQFAREARWSERDREREQKEKEQEQLQQIRHKDPSKQSE